MKKTKTAKEGKLQVLIGEKRGPIFIDLVELGHLLIVGWANSKKEAITHSIVQSSMFLYTPQDVRIILFDSKSDLVVYGQQNPYLLTKVMSEPVKCISALKWTSAEIEHRYKNLRVNRLTNIDELNVTADEKTPHIIFVIKTMDYLVNNAGVDVWSMLTDMVSRGANVGIHFVLVPERLNKSIIPADISSNMPNRIICQLTSQRESKAVGVIDADKMKDGEFFFLKFGDNPQKCNMVESKSNIPQIVKYFEKNNPKVSYTQVSESPANLSGYEATDDPLLPQVVDLVRTLDVLSASLLQRKFKIGFARAARIMDRLEEEGVLGPAEGAKPRIVLKKIFTPFRCSGVI